MPPDLRPARRRLSALGLVLAVALAVRLLPATVRFVVGTDEALYLTLAQHLAAGDGYTADGIHPHTEFDPGYPLFAAAVYRLINLPARLAGDAASAAAWLELPARLNIVLFGGLLALPVYGIAATIAGDDPRLRGLAWRAGLLTALLPALVLGARDFEAASEQLYTVALWTGWLLLWLGLDRRRWLYLLGSGVAFGVAHLSRWEGLVCAGIATLLAALPPSLAGWRAMLRGLRPGWGAAVLGGTLLLAGPYAAYQIARTGSFFSTKAIVHQLHGEALASPDPFAWEKAYGQYERVRYDPSQFPPLPVYLWQHRAQTAVNYLRNTVQQLVILFTSPTYLTLLWLPLAVLGARRLPRRHNALLVATLFPALIFPLSVVDQRYLLSLLPAAMLWSAAGLLTLDAWLATRLQTTAGTTAHMDQPRTLPAREGGLRHVLPRLESPVAVTLLLCALLLLADIAAVWVIAAPVEYRALGVWMRANGVTAADTVLARKRQVAFYAGARWDWLLFGDTDALLADAAQRGARYAVIDQRTTPSLRPALAYLLDPAVAPPSLSLVHQLPGPPAILLYQFAGSP